MCKTLNYKDCLQKQLQNFRQVLLHLDSYFLSIQQLHSSDLHWKRLLAGKAAKICMSTEPETVLVTSVRICTAFFLASLYKANETMHAGA